MNKFSRGKLFSFVCVLFVLIALISAVPFLQREQTSRQRAASGGIFPMQIISRGVPAFSSSGTASLANDNLFDTTWRSNGSQAWLAYDLSKIPVANRSKVILVWYNETFSYEHTLIGENAYNMPGTYTIDINSAPGNTQPPVNGWKTVVTVTNNHYHSRQHVFDMTGANWVRINVTAVDGSPQNTDVDINMDVYDASQGIDDDFIDYGDSITATAMGHATQLSVKSFSDLVQLQTGSHFPIEENGGTGYLTSIDGVNNMQKWLSVFPGKFVGLSFGTNDSWGCGNGANIANTVYNNYLAMVKIVIASGKIPIVTLMPWSTHSDLASCAIAINAKLITIPTIFPQIILGPDLYTALQGHPEYFSDGVHPSSLGTGIYRKTWADLFIKSIYNGYITVQPSPTSEVSPNFTPSPSPTSVITKPTPTGSTLSPAPTIAPGDTSFSLTVFLHDVGFGGDNVNPQGLGNTNPKHLQRNITVTAFDMQNNSFGGQGIISYNEVTGDFTGIVDMGKLNSGNYLVKIKSDEYLAKLIPTFQTIKAKQNNIIAPVYLIAGDVNNDNLLNILDYTAIVDCFGSKVNSSTCKYPPTQKNIGADINDDGVIDGIDYNAFVRELSVQQGDGNPGPVPLPSQTSTPTPTIPIFSPTPSLTPKPSQNNGKVNWSSGFYPGWQQASYPPNTLPWQAITQLNQFSLLTGKGRDGSIDTTAHGLTPSFMQAAVVQAHKQNRKIFITIGGADDNNWDGACNITNRITFINNLVGIVQQYGYDGVDLDIEQDFGSPAHTDYIACVSGIRNALNNLTPKKGLTEDGDPDWQGYMLAQVWQYLDQINLMSYGVTASTVQKGLSNYTSKGIPANLLSIGIGLESGEADATSSIQDCIDKVQYALGLSIYNSSHTVYGGVMQWTIPDDPVDHNGQYSCLNAIGSYVPTQ